MTAPIDPDTAWFRELLFKTLGWGVAGLLLTAGWFAVGDGKVVDAGSPGGSKLLPYAVISWVAWIAWSGVVIAIHRRCTRHPTIPTGRVLALVLLTLTLFKVLLDVFVLD